MRSLSDLPAPAKINRFLHVVGRRADGYHRIESVFQPLDWADTLHLEARADGRIERTDLADAVPAEDLCVRAARALQQAAGVREGVQILLEKRLPAGAGMGGGSSDAATVLLGLNRLWNLRWTRDALQALGARLGADVPFFLGPGPAFVHGIGERLAPLGLPVVDLVVVKPLQSLPTERIFRDPALRRDSVPIMAGSPHDDGDACAGAPDPDSGAVAQRVQELLGADADWGRNDLEPVATMQCPAVGAAQQWLASQFGNGRMTGSGSAVFSRLQPGTASQVDPAARLEAFVASGEPGSALLRGAVARRCRTLAEHPLAGYANDDR